MKKEYLQPIIEIEEYDDVVICSQGYDTLPSNSFVEDEFPEVEFG